MFSHPTWIDDSQKVRRDLPPALQELREGEKLLIQQVSPYVPVQHMQKGSYGCKGHVCSFPQDITSICTILPRLPTDVNLVNVVKSFLDSEKNPQKLTFRIRKDKVLAALHWLVRYNTEYKNVTIKESNLGWMTQEEQDLPCCRDTGGGNDTMENESNDANYVNIHDDPNPTSTGNQTYGYITTPNSRNNPQEKDKAITEVLQQAHDQYSSGTTIDFPYVSENPINEYDMTQKLFCLAFPWLFPGGVGDVNDCCEVKETVEEWMKRLLCFEDGRFCRDKIWFFLPLTTLYGGKIHHQEHTLLMAFSMMVPKPWRSSNNKFPMEIMHGLIAWLTFPTTSKGLPVTGDTKGVRSIPGLTTILKLVMVHQHYF